MGRAAQAAVGNSPRSEVVRGSRRGHLMPTRWTRVPRLPTVSWPMNPSISRTSEPLVSALVKELEPLLRAEARKLARELLLPLASVGVPPRGSSQAADEKRGRPRSKRSDAPNSSRSKRTVADGALPAASVPPADPPTAGLEVPAKAEPSRGATVRPAAPAEPALLLDVGDVTTDASGQRLVRVVRRKRPS